MITRLKLLFSLDVWHDYYGEVCPDVGFVVPEASAALLRGAGMIAKPVDSGLCVLHRDADPAALPAARRTVRIGLVAQDHDFANITEGFNPASGALHYRNTQLAGALDDPPGTAVLREVDPELWRAGAFAIVEIMLASGFAASPPRFRVRLGARTEPWRYYVVVKGLSNGDVDQLAVQEQTSGAVPGPPAFEKVPPAQLTGDERSQAEILAAGGAKVLLFRSVTGIARRARASRQFQLLRNTEPVIERLPHPGKRRGTADLIVQLSKSKP